MKILKLLNKKNLSIIIIYLLSSFSVMAENEPADIWNIDKKDSEIKTKENNTITNGFYKQYKI